MAARRKRSAGSKVLNQVRDALQGNKSYLILIALFILSNLGADEYLSREQIQTDLFIALGAAGRSALSKIGL